MESDPWRGNWPHRESVPRRCRSGRLPKTGPEVWGCDPDALLLGDSSQRVRSGIKLAQIIISLKPAAGSFVPRRPPRYRAPKAARTAPSVIDLFANTGANTKFDPYLSHNAPHSTVCACALVFAIRSIPRVLHTNSALS